MVKIEGLYTAAYNAYRNISFSPEKRAEEIVRDYEEELNAYLTHIPQEEQAQFIANYKAKLFSWLNSMSRTASPMITGPSNFPTARMKKYNQWEQNKYNEFQEWRERAIKAISRKVEAAKPEDQKTDEHWQQVKKSILDSAQVIADIDSGRNITYTRSLFVNSITGLIKRNAANGAAEVVKRSLALLKEINASSSKPIITATNGIWKLEQAAEAAKETAQDNARRENKEIPFDGGTVVLNYAENRVQIIYDQKPDVNTISKLKGEAFKYSWTNNAWQRFLTNAGMYAAGKVLGIEIKL